MSSNKGRPGCKQARQDLRHQSGIVGVNGYSCTCVSSIHFQNKSKVCTFWAAMEISLSYLIIQLVQHLQQKQSSAANSCCGIQDMKVNGAAQLRRCS